MRSRSRLLLIILYIWSTWGVIATLLLLSRLTAWLPTTTTPTVYYDNGGPFTTSPLACPANMIVSAGPTWREITIGLSTLQDVENLYGVRAVPEEPHYSGDFGRSFNISLTAEAAQERKISAIIDFCVVDGKVAAFTVPLAYDDTLPTSQIDSWLSRYGRPELVTWVATGNTWEYRTLIWPGEGIALDVNVSLVEQEPHLAWVGSITFFPYAQGDNYLGQWPYTGLNRQAPTSNNDAGNPTEENPFDFDSMLATPTPSN